MVLASFGEEFPESAVVEYVSENDILVFDTDRGSRKYKNILKNPRVSVTIGWDNDNEEETLQMHGICTEITGDELVHLKSVYFAKIPSAQKWENEPGTVYLKIEPVWARHTDLKTYPWKTTEIEMNRAN